LVRKNAVTAALGSLKLQSFPDVAGARGLTWSPKKLKHHPPTFSPLGSIFGPSSL